MLGYLFRGSLENEIMLPQNCIAFLGKSYHPGDTVSFDVTGTGHETEYILSGILDDSRAGDSYAVYLSKPLVSSLTDQFQVTAYTRLNTDATSAAAILDFASKITEPTGLVEDQIYLTEFTAVMTGAVRSGIQLPIPMLAALTATIAYGVFYTKIAKNVQMFGQLRTIGMTKKQIRHMARREGLQYAFTGIPLGLAAGLLIGLAVSPGTSMSKRLPFMGC